VGLKEEILKFLDMKDIMFPQSKDKNSKIDLAFWVDMLEHLNNLNVILQAKDPLVHELYTYIQAFKRKLILFSKQVKENKFTYFHILRRIHKF
jgi:hypothetical protein